MQCQAVFFDLDGTLADSKEMLYEVYEAFLRRFGQSGSIEEFQSLDGAMLEGIVTALKANHQIDSEIENLIGIYRSQLVSGFENIDPMPGAREILQHFSQRQKRQFLVTSALKPFAQAFIDIQGWADFFEGVITGDQVENGKPEPDIYELALSVAGLDHSEVIVVEDSANGVAAAKAAGCTVLRICPPSARTRLAQVEGVTEIESLAELESLIE